MSGFCGCKGDSLYTPFLIYVSSREIQKDVPVPNKIVLPRAIFFAVCVHCADAKIARGGAKKIS